jgi:hypothetical protein
MVVLVGEEVTQDETLVGLGGITCSRPARYSSTGSMDEEKPKWQAF